METHLVTQMLFQSMRSKEMMIGGLPVEIIKKKGQKNLYIRVNSPDGKVTVSAPSGLSDEYIKSFVIKKLSDIIEARDSIISKERMSRREYLTGEIHYLWGEPYRLEVVYGGSRYMVERSSDKIVMTVPDGTDMEIREKLITEWYRSELNQVLGKIAAC